MAMQLSSLAYRVYLDHICGTYGPYTEYVCAWYTVHRSGCGDHRGAQVEREDDGSDLCLVDCCTVANAIVVLGHSFMILERKPIL